MTIRAGVQAAPDDWKVVPSRPTKEMIWAFMNEPPRIPMHELDEMSEMSEFAYAYSAMLAAAPSASRTITPPLLETLKFALQDAMGFAELIAAMAKPDVEIYKHELRGDSERAQQRIAVALQAIEDATSTDLRAESGECGRPV